MPPTSAQRQQIAAFAAITSTSDKVATKVSPTTQQNPRKNYVLTTFTLQFLKNNGWKVDAAMDQ